MKSNPLRIFVMTSLIVSALFITIFLPLAETHAHSEDTFIPDENNTRIAVDQNVLRELNINVAVIAAILLLIFVFIALASEKNGGDRAKKIIFSFIVIVIAFPTLFFAGSTIYLNLFSATKGPVHWHADFKVIACGEEVKSVSVKGLSNKLGTNLLHEHEDRRIHIEGVVVKESDVSLDKFFEVQGGELLSDSFIIPTNDGLRTITNGDQCENGERGMWQVFLYTTDGGIARQKKLDDFIHYVPSSHTNVPPGDCIIFEFGPEKERTDQLCDFYQLEVGKGSIKIL